jgi:ankyrin repeat protein
MAAVSSGSAQVLQLLLAAVQLPLPSSTANCAVRLAITKGQHHLLQQLFDAGADRGAALWSAAAYSSLPDVDSAAVVNVLQYLLAAGVPVDSTHAHGMTAVMSAAVGGSVRAAQVLLAAGAAVDARDSADTQHCTMLLAWQDFRTRKPQHGGEVADPGRASSKSFYF